METSRPRPRAVRLESIRRTYARVRAQGNIASNDRERDMRPIRYASNVLLRFPGPRFEYAIMVQVYPAKTLGSFFLTLYRINGHQLVGRARMDRKIVVASVSSFRRSALESLQNMKVAPVDSSSPRIGTLSNFLRGGSSMRFSSRSLHWSSIDLESHIVPPREVP